MIPPVQPIPELTAMKSNRIWTCSGPVRSRKMRRSSFVIAKNTNTTTGVDIAADYIIEQQLAPVLTESFGACELQLGTTQNQMINARWAMGAAEGITIVVSTGDSGSAGCDFDDPGISGAQPARFGLAVSGTRFHAEQRSGGRHGFQSAHQRRGILEHSRTFRRIRRLFSDMFRRRLGTIPVRTRFSAWWDSATLPKLIATTLRRSCGFDRPDWRQRWREQLHNA